MSIRTMFYIGNIQKRHTYEKKTHLVLLYLNHKEKNSVTGRLPLKPIDEHKYRGDFLGLLKASDVPEYLHIPVMLLNNIPSSNHYTKPLGELKYPNDSAHKETMDFIHRLPQNVI